MQCNTAQYLANGTVHWFVVLSGAHVVVGPVVMGVPHSSVNGKPVVAAPPLSKLCCDPTKPRSQGPAVAR